MKDKNSSTQYTRSFFGLLGAQFFGAFNDNLFKLLVIFELIALYGTEKIVSITAFTGALFVVPFLVFSPVGGILADKFSKRKVFHLFKLAEIVIMGLGVAGFTTHNPLVLYLSLFLMSLQSALLGPAKTGLIPEIVSDVKLAKANSLLVTASFLAIISGTGAASLLSLVFASTYTCVSYICLLIAAAGAFCSHQIEQTDVTHSTQSTAIQYRESISNIIRIKPLLWSILGSSMFLFIGAFVQLSTIPFGMTVLGLGRESSSNLFLFAALGIGSGSTLAGYLSHTRIETRIIPVGAFGITISAMLMLAYGTSISAVAIIMVLMGFFSGLFTVPLQTIIQQYSPAKHRGMIIAINSTLDFSGVLAASGILWILDMIHIPVNKYFTVIVLLGAFITIFSILLLIRILLPIIPKILVRLVYRLKVHGLENIPAHGGALFIFNHISWIDALIIIAASPRPVRFMMARNLYNFWFLKPLMKLINIIPIAYTDGPHQLAQSFKRAQDALKNGDILCIFPEGKLTHDGFIARFKNGFNKIVTDSRTPLIPGYFDGVWGTGYSYYGGKLFNKPFHFKRKPVSVYFGKALSGQKEPEELRHQIELLGAECASMSISDNDTLGIRFISIARKNWFKKILHDTTGKKLSFGKVLTGSLILAKYIEKHTFSDSMIGVILPATAGAALVNTGITLSGKIPVNLNFTASSKAINSAVKQCSINFIITSKQFLKKVPLEPISAKFLFIEDILRSITISDKIKAISKAMFIPSNISFRKISQIRSNDTATVIFSSGSTSEPKGIVLSHKNILSNIESMQKAIVLSSKDHLCSALPFFHSFGYTVTLWYPLIKGFAVSYHTNPIDGPSIAKMVKDNQGTLLLATPTFLQSYIRKATKEDFSSLRLVIVGAEKLRSSLADAFEEKFGIRPLEGYGATELSPVVSLNLPNRTIAKRFNICCKEGTIGRTLPGIVAKIVDPQTGETRGCDKDGMLLIKGPNVMVEYLNRPELTVEALHDGWYRTGDIAQMDNDGFITLKGRLSRFSKIGGEMVPHGAIEETIFEHISADELCLAVTAVADSNKGEKLVVLYTPQAGTEETIREIVANSELPNLWKPDIFLSVGHLPLLGSGKLDLLGLKKTAELLMTEQMCSMAA